MRKIILVFILILAFGCRAKKSVFEKETTTKIDTVLITKEKIKYEQLTDSVYIESPCDTVGNLKEFSAKINGNRGYMSLSNENGRIKAKINLDSIVSVLENRREIKLDQKEIIKEKLIVKNKYPLLLIGAFIFSVLLNILLLKNIKL